MSYYVNPSTPMKITLNETDTVKSVLQNVKIILATLQLTVPLYREFGLPGRFVDKPIPVAKALMVGEVKEAIERWEPRASLLNISFEEDIAFPGKLVPAVEVEIQDE